jgi:hypothetical protein
MRSGRRRETPTMGVVVAVPDRRQLDLPPRSLVLSPNARRRDFLRERERPSRRCASADSMTHPRPRTDLRRQSDSGLVARLGGAAQARILARAAVSRARRPALAVAAYPAACTCQTSERMLPLYGGGGMRYKVGAEQLEQVPSMVRRPNGVFRSARITPIGPTHAVATASDATACGIPARRLHLLDQDWEASFIEKCPACFNAVLTDG